MITVYALKSIEKNFIYVGMTSDLKRRIAEHNNCQNRSTKAFAPLILIYQEEFPTREEARMREKYLKSGIGKEFLKSIV